MDSIDKSNALKAFFIIYILATNNVISNLVPKKLINQINENRIAQHFIGLITVLVILNLIGGNDINKLFYQSVGIYIIFILSTKLDITINLSILGIAFLIYIQEIKFRKKIKEMESDNLVNENKIKNKHKEQDSLRYIALSIVSILLLFGVIKKYKKKEIQYGGNFNAIRFFMDGSNNQYGGTSYKI